MYEKYIFYFFKIICDIIVSKKFKTLQKIILKKFKSFGNVREWALKDALFFF